MRSLRPWAAIAATILVACGSSSERSTPTAAPAAPRVALCPSVPAGAEWDPLASAVGGSVCYAAADGARLQVANTSVGDVRARIDRLSDNIVWAREGDWSPSADGFESTWVDVGRRFVVTVSQHSPGGVVFISLDVTDAPTLDSDDPSTAEPSGDCDIPREGESMEAFAARCM